MDQSGSTNVTGSGYIGHMLIHDRFDMVSLRIIPHLNLRYHEIGDGTPRIGIDDALICWGVTRTLGFVLKKP